MIGTVTIVITGDADGVKALAKRFVNRLDNHVDWVNTNQRGKITKVVAKYSETTIVTGAAIDMELNTRTGDLTVISNTTAP